MTSDNQPNSLFKSSSRSRAKRNLAMLQRIDPDVSSVVTNAGHAVLHTLLNPEDTNRREWIKDGIEGNCFVALVGDQMERKLFIINRLSPENLVQELETGLIWETQNNFFFFKGGEKVRGIWFSKEEGAQLLKDALSN